MNRSQTTGEIIGIAEEEWNATIPTKMLHASPESKDLASATFGNVKISLSPSSSQISPRPGHPRPTEEIVVKYEQLSPAWKAGYRLETDNKTKTTALTGWMLFENQTGLDWKGIDVALVESSTPTASASPISLTGVSLPREHGRLALQKPIPLDTNVQPFLVFDPTLDCCHPIKQTRISLSQSAARGLPAGPVTVFSDGAPSSTVQFRGVAPGGSAQLAHPGTVELDMCIERNNRPVRTTFLGVCLRRGCFDYRERRRTLFFNVNHSNKYDGKAVEILFQIPGEQCWEPVASISTLPMGSSIQQVEVEQDAKLQSIKSIDLYSAPLDVIRSLDLDPSDPYAALLKKVVEQRNAQNQKALDTLLCCPDVVIDSVQLVCEPVKPGMIPEVLVTIRNVGGSGCVFPIGTPIVSLDRFNQAIAGPAPLVLDACCSKTLRLRATGPVTGNANLSVLVDPAGKVDEAAEDNNRLTFELKVVP